MTLLNFEKVKTTDNKELLQCGTTFIDVENKNVFLTTCGFAEDFDNLLNKFIEIEIPNSPQSSGVYVILQTLGFDEIIDLSNIIKTLILKK